MGKNKQYWKGLEEAERDPDFLASQKNEFPEEIPVQDALADEGLTEGNTGRRDFLKFLGFSMTAAALASCEAPVNKVVPYVNRPEEIIPGKALWYATSMAAGGDVASILVRTREGRPNYIAGNKANGDFGALLPRINSSVLPLYDGERLQQPEYKGQLTNWEWTDKTITDKLNEVASAGGSIRILAESIVSPTTKKVVDQFLEQYGKKGKGGDARLIQRDEVSHTGIREAHKATFGRSVIPSFNLSNAKSIVSIGADFLGNWLMPNALTAQYKKNRNPEDQFMSRHYQFESILSLTGTNADVRIPIKPSEEGLVAAAIYDHLAEKAGAQKLGVDTGELAGITKKAAADLWQNRGASLVMGDSNRVDEQIIINGINELLRNYGKTLHLDAPLYTHQGDEKAVDELITEMKEGKVDVLLHYGGNPGYSLPQKEEFRKALEKVGMTVSFSGYRDETASYCDHICPDHHYLEAWNDLEPVAGKYFLAQPVIRPLYDTRQAQDSLLKWTGEKASFHDRLKQEWKENILSGGNGLSWEEALQVGGGRQQAVGSSEQGGRKFKKSSLREAGSRIKKVKVEGGTFELKFYTKTSIGDGRHGNNPWLQEMPDPVSKITWDNYITMAPADMEGWFKTRIGQQDPADLATISVGGKSMTLPVCPQPGQKRGTIGIALGYGRGEQGERVGNAAFQYGEYGALLKDENGQAITVGKNAYPLLGMAEGNQMRWRSEVNISKVGKTYPLATTQVHHTIMGRDSILKETTLQTFLTKPKKAYNPPHTMKMHEDGKTIDKPVDKINLWEEHDKNKMGHHWGLSIDLTKCIGCGSCITGCHSENNVPVVGKDEVRRSRDMFWMRIDRYYSSKGEEELKAGREVSHEIADTPEDHPEVTHMPMMCQHCDHAPCETVCPVAATTHSNEGMNQMAYNRCVGTRYCANNCPFKVRRFNWFNYNGYKKFSAFNPAQSDMGRMVLNPDVTVRSRGVMEKCSFCVQRTQAGKLEAKKAGQPLEDGAIQTACMEACPTDAIIFGDVNDKESQARKLQDDKRTYYALEELGVRPNVSYRVKVRNPEEGQA